VFAVKVLVDKDKRDVVFSKDLAEIVSYIKSNLNNNLSIINDNSCIEIVSGSAPVIDGEIVIELLVKKTISLNKNSFKEDLKKEVKSFYKKIEK